MSVGHQEIEVTLNRAHKLSSRIVDMIAIKLTEIRQAAMPIHITEVNMNDSIKLKDAELDNLVGQYYNLMTDLRNLKIAIGEANSKVGVDTILTNKTMLNNEMTLYTSILSGLGRTEFEYTPDEAQRIVKERSDAINNKGQGYGVVPNILIRPISKESKYSKENIENLIQGCKREQYKADDQLSNLNASKIHVEISDYAYSMLYS